MIDYTTFKDLRIFSVADECLFFLMHYNTDAYEEAIKQCNPPCREQLLLVLYYVLLEKDDDYNLLTDYLEDCANGIITILGTKNRSYVSKEEFASNLLTEIEILNRPNPLYTRKSAEKICAYF